MQLRNSTRGYGALAMLLHWLITALVALTWLLGTFGDELPRGIVRSAGFVIHVSIGLTILILLAVRIAWRFFDPPPPLETTRFGTWLGVAAKLTHFVLYGLVFATPLVGLLMQFAREDTLPIFGITDIASPWVKDRTFAGSLKEIHETLANLLMIAAGLHAAVALAHHWILRDRTLSRMLPGMSR